MLHTATANSVTFTKLWTVGRELCNNKKYGVKHGMLFRPPLLSFRFFDLGKTAAKLPCVYRNKTDCLTSVKNLNRSRCCGLAWVKGATHYVGARISTGGRAFWVYFPVHCEVSYREYSLLLCPPAVGGIKRYRDLSACLSRGAAALGAQLP